MHSRQAYLNTQTNVLRNKGPDAMGSHTLVIIMRTLHNVSFVTHPNPALLYDQNAGVLSAMADTNWSHMHASAHHILNTVHPRPNPSGPA
jgi:hypothetical protein